jgi:hypothetical protein
MKTLARLTLVVAALVSSQVSFASGADLRAFFGKLEGRWQGQGSQVGPGARNGRKFDLEISVDRPGSSPTWSMQDEHRFDAGVIAPYSVGFAVRGDTLFASNHSATEPVTVTESTATSLSYETRRQDVLTLQVYDYSYSYVLSGRTLTGRVVTKFQGDVLIDESFVVRK